ncbi:MAG: beta-lactamase family protein [Oscillospiraceae bacterium]|jgi:CubicO group peptidase (beta-lactamase class C family)|nr:beta-lactamase family protein [Oscillospiraceae bacterium]
MGEFDFIKPMLDQAVLDGTFPSAAAAVGVRERVLFVCAAGGARDDTLFDLASLTKPVGATMIALRAIEEGALTLYDPLARFFDNVPQDKSEITVFQLMTHTAKLTPTFRLDLELDDPKDAVGAILRRPLEDIPDGTPNYSCMGYILLGKILEIIYGAPLDALARDKVFKPLGLVRTTYNPLETDWGAKADIAPTEIDQASGVAWRGIVHDENARFLKGVSGNAGIFSDVRDVARYASMLARGGADYLAPATFRKATANYTPGCDTYRGLGFHISGSPSNFIGDLFPTGSFGHTGFTGTSFAVDPQSGLFAVLLSNRVHPTRENQLSLRFRRVFHNRVYAAYSRALAGGGHSFI